MRRGILVVLSVLLGLVAAEAQAVEIKQVTTPLGIKAWLVEDKSAPLIALSFSFGGGTATEPASRTGVTSLMALMLTDGAGAYPAEAFRLRQEEANASIGFGASPDRLGGSLRVLTASRDEGFDLLRLAMAEPRFDESMLEQRRAQTIASLNQSEQRPGSVAERAMMSRLFAGHPYGRDWLETRETVKTVTAAELKARAADLLTRKSLLVTAVGDIDAPELARQLDRTFGALPMGRPQPPLPAWVPPAKPGMVVIERPVPQSTVLIAMPSLTRDDPDWYAALVAVYILGGGQQSRLFDEVREKRGLAYSVSAGLRSSEKAGLLVISTGSANEHVAEAIGVIRAELARFREHGVTEQELSDAKTYLTGSLALSLDSSGAIATLVQGMQVDKLPLDYLDRRAGLIASVTALDVRRVAERLLRDDAMVTVVVGKPVGLAVER